MNRILRFSPLLLVFVLVSLATAQQYPQPYQVHDDGESSSADDSSPRRPAYSEYYASETSPNGQTSGESAAEDSGFVQPIDFSALFGATNIGFGGDAAGSTQIFRPTNPDLNNFALPLSNSASAFPAELEGSATTKNSEHGFTNPNANFQSFFDTSGSATEVGFRPQDFLKPQGDKVEEENSPVANAGSYTPSFANFEAEYNSRPGPHYTHHAVPAAAEQRPNKSTYRVPAESEEDAPTFSPASSKDSYNEKSSYKVAPTEGYSLQPNYKIKKPDYVEGKSSYATAADKHVYRPVYSSPSPDRASSSETLKSSYPPPLDYYSSKSTYRPSPSEHQQRRKPIYSSPAPLDIYGKSSYVPASTEQREEKPRFLSQIDSDITYGKSLPPSFQPPSSEPHQGKSSYPAPYPTDVYNEKYIAKPSPSAQPNFYTSTTIPFNSGKSSVPVTKSVTSTAGSPSNKEESYEEEPADHGPPEYTPSGTATDKKKCKKIDKRLTADDVATGRFRRDAMTCYECEDPKTGGTFEQCSYSSDPKSKSYFIGHAQKYSTNSGTKPTTYRYRRYLSNDPFGQNGEKEGLVAAETQSRAALRDYDYEFAATGNNNNKGDYRFGPEYFISGSDDYTEYKPSGTSIDEKNCQKTKKDSMNCMVCKDPKTGSSYEQCSYTAEPKENNYYVAHASSFNTGNKKPYIERHSSYEFPHKVTSSDEPHSRHIRQEPSLVIKKERSKVATKNKISEKYDTPYEFSASTIAGREAKEERTAGVGLDPFLYGTPEPYSPKAAEKVAEATDQHASYFPGGKSYDEYFRHLFPELHEGGKESASSDSETYYYPSSANTKNEKTTSPGFVYKSTLPDYFTNNEQKKDLEKVLGEFTQKDRSDCKKVIKDKMTCYKCVDSKGMQHEECMFVAASEPKSSHLAYHEVKEYRLVPPPGVSDGKGSGSSSLPLASDSVSSSSSDITKTSDNTSTPTDKITQTEVTTTTAKPKRKTFFKKVTSSTSTAASPVADSKYGETSKVEILKVMQKPSKPLSSSPSSSAKSPAVAVRLTRRSSKTSIHTTTTTLTTPEPPPKKRKISKKAVKSDAEQAASDNHEKKVPISTVVPPEPELSASDLGPDGYYSAETKTKFDPILKVTLPEYMLTRSEHEAIFDEVMASGRRR